MTKEERQRYSRHILLSEVGEVGQQKLSEAKVLVVGAGGLGCPVLQYLAAAGVGTIGIIDFDSVDISNLQRQILYSTEDVGKNKTETAKEKLTALNPLISINAYTYQLTTDNALELFEQYDIIVDGTDNFTTRYLVNDASLLTGKPLVFGSIHRFEGQVSVFNYKNGPSYRCLFPNPPKPGEVPSCSEAGVLGVLPGVIGSLQATETIKIILDLGNVSSGKLLTYNALDLSFNTLKIFRNEDAVQSVIDRKAAFSSYDYDLFCGISKEPQSDEVTANELQSLLEKDFELIDIRELYEEPRITELEVHEIPMQTLSQDPARIDEGKNYILCCQTGQRSKALVDFFKTQGKTGVYSLKGGVEALR